MYDKPGRPPYHLQARTLRREKGLSQSDVARRLGISQSQVARLENGQGTKEQSRTYWERIVPLNANRRRTGGGAQKVGRVQRQVGSKLTPPSAYRGEDLSDDYPALLPTPWEMLAKCRASQQDELALLWDESTQRWGMTSFHLISGEVRRGRIIPIERDEEVSMALEAWAHGYVGEASPNQTDDPDAILGDDE